MASAAEYISLKGLSKNSDILIALAVVGILILMIIPLPKFLLDVLVPLVDKPAAVL